MQARGGRVFRDALAEADINGVLVLGHIVVELIEPAVAHLHVDVAAEERLEEFNEGGHDARLAPPSKWAEKPVWQHPGSGVQRPWYSGRTTHSSTMKNVCPNTSEGSPTRNTRASACARRTGTPRRRRNPR